LLDLLYFIGEAKRSSKADNDKGISLGLRHLQEDILIPFPQRMYYSYVEKSGGKKLQPQWRICEPPDEVLKNKIF
jgi:hypothetical protein